MLAANPSNRSLFFFIKTDFTDSPTNTSEHTGIHLYFLVLLFSIFLVFVSMRWIKLTSISFWAHVEMACCICVIPLTCGIREQFVMCRSVLDFINSFTVVVRNNFLHKSVKKIFLPHLKCVVTLSGKSNTRRIMRNLTKLTR